MQNDLLSTTEVAAKLGLSRQRVLHLIKSGRLPALKVGHSYVVQEAALAAVRERPTGRPKKAGVDSEPT